MATALAEYRAAVQAALDDGFLTREEFQKLRSMRRSLGIPSDLVTAEIALLNKERAISRMVEGNMPKAESSIMLRKNEVCHAEVAATLIEERTRREYRSVGSGVSIRVTKGVYWHVGGSRGQSVPVEEMRDVDEGTLTITSRRVVFTGSRRTANLDLRKLLRMQSYVDAVQVYVENRQKAPAFRVEDPDLIGATILIAAQRLSE